MARSKKAKAAAKRANRAQDSASPPNGLVQGQDNKESGANPISNDDHDPNTACDLEAAESATQQESDAVHSSSLAESEQEHTQSSRDERSEPPAPSDPESVVPETGLEDLHTPCNNPSLEPEPESLSAQPTTNDEDKDDDNNDNENGILDSYGSSEDTSMEVATVDFEDARPQPIESETSDPESMENSDENKPGISEPLEATVVESQNSSSGIVPELCTMAASEPIEGETLALKIESENVVVKPLTSNGSSKNLKSASLPIPNSVLDRTPIVEAMRLAKLDQPILPPKSELGLSRSNSLLQSRFDRLNAKYLLRDEHARSSILTGTENIKRTFNDIKDTVGGLTSSVSYNIDWELWTLIVNDYELALKNDLERLYAAVLLGIPKEFRGIVWQLVSRSKNFELEELYMQLKTEPSAHEKSIKRDLTRTSFFTNVEQVKKSDELFNVIKAYSLFDPDVGYTQGMIFIAVPLIMNISEAECFSLLVTLMKDYGLRELFCPEMRGLHLMLYQFDRLLETRSPLLYNHLVRQGIKSSMYASQWFLTFFAYKFPLDTVLRIYDILITQGIEAIFKFAINLMMVNERHIMGLKFDVLLTFLKNDLFEVYLNSNFGKETNERGGAKSSTRRISAILGGKPAGPGQNTSTGKYDLDKYVADSLQLELEPIELAQYEQEFDRIYQDEINKAHLIEQVKIENGKLRQQIKNLEIKYLALNYEHLDAVQQMVDVQLSLPELYEQHAELAQEIKELKGSIEQLESRGTCESEPLQPHTSSGDTPASANANETAIPVSIDQNIQNLLQVNAEHAELCANLEDELAQLSKEEASLDEQISTRSKKWFKW